MNNTTLSPEDANVLKMHININNSALFVNLIKYLIINKVGAIAKRISNKLNQEIAWNVHLKLYIVMDNVYAFLITI